MHSPSAFAFHVPLPRPHTLQSSLLRHQSRSPFPRPTSRPARLPPRATSKPSLPAGSIVAVQRGRQIDLARVVSSASSGDTVDLILLEEFVPELYIPRAKSAETYERAENIRPIASQYAASQQGWIVLRSDLKAAENYFALREPPTPQKAVVVPSNDDKLPRRELNEDALKRQVFEPTKTQAFVAAALSIPASALFYAAFAAARDTYAANPLSDDAASEQLFRNLLLFVCGAASVSCIIVGSFLFIYALSKKSDES